MAKRHSFGVKDAVGVVSEGGGGRVPAPPAGTYRGVLTQLNLKVNSNGDPMLTAIVQLKITDKKLAKHDGYWVWNRLNLTDQGKGYVNAFLNALAGSEQAGLALQKDLWENGLLATEGEYSASSATDVLTIGKFKIGSPDGKRPIGVALVERSYTNKNGEEVETVDVTRYLPASDVGAATNGDESDGDLDEDGGDPLDDLDDGLEDGEAADDGLDDLDDDLDEDGDEKDPELAALKAELEDFADDAAGLKGIRIKARDEYGISVADTKGKTVEEVAGQILEAFANSGDTAGAAKKGSGEKPAF